MLVQFWRNFAIKNTSCLTLIFQRYTGSVFDQNRSQTGSQNGSVFRKHMSLFPWSFFLESAWLISCWFWCISGAILDTFLTSFGRLLMLFRLPFTRESSFHHPKLPNLTYHRDATYFGHVFAWFFKHYLSIISTDYKATKHETNCR